MPVELFTNDGTTQVLTGGTTAPASGTTETWTVASSSSFPGASSALGTVFHVSDPFLPTEKTLVTNVSGTTWTVTRGAEGTVPLAHAPGFTIRQVATAGWLNSVLVAVMPSGDTSGATDAVNIQNACSALVNGGLVLLGPGSFYISSQVTVPAQTTSGTSGGLPVSIQGSGPATVIYVVGSITGIYYHRTVMYGNQYAAPADMTVGFLRDFVVDGTFATGNAIGVDVGDGWGGVVDLRIVNFSGTGTASGTSPLQDGGATGQIGLMVANRVGWTEKWHIRAHLINNNINVRMVNAGGGSMEYNDLDYHIQAYGGQIGFQLLNGAYLAGGRLRMTGNFGGAASGPFTPPAIQIGGTNETSPFSYIGSQWLDIACEMQSSLAVTAQTILFGASGNYINNCDGLIAFRNGGANWVNFTNAAAGQFSFVGAVIGNDTNLTSRSINPVPWTVLNQPAVPASFNPANPPAYSATTSTVMMGLAKSHTPSGSGNVLVIFTFQAFVSTAAVAITLGARYGTGTAPLNAATATGTRFGGGGDPAVTPSVAGSSGKVPFTFHQVLSLTPGTTYWFDGVYGTSSTADAVNVSNPQFSFIELP